MGRSLGVLFIFLLVLTLSGCETVRGFGRDMQKAGSWMERQVSNHRN